MRQPDPQNMIARIASERPLERLDGFAGTAHPQRQETEVGLNGEVARPLLHQEFEFGTGSPEVAGCEE